MPPGFTSGRAIVQTGLPNAHGLESTGVRRAQEDSPARVTYLGPAAGLGDPDLRGRAPPDEGGYSGDH